MGKKIKKVLVFWAKHVAIFIPGFVAYNIFPDIYTNMSITFMKFFSYNLIVLLIITLFLSLYKAFCIKNDTKPKILNKFPAKMIFSLTLISCLLILFKTINKIIYVPFNIWHLALFFMFTITISIGLLTNDWRDFLSYLKSSLYILIFYYFLILYALIFLGLTFIT